MAEGESDFILNIRIDRDWEAGTVKISQPAAISKLAAKFHLDDITKTGAPLMPMRPDLHLQKAVGDKIINRDVFDYASVVGSLLYLSLTCRPDISVATGILSRFMACPGQEHCDAAKQVVSYLYGTKDLGIIYRRGSAKSIPVAYGRAEKSKLLKRQDAARASTELQTYADADFAATSTPIKA